MDKYYNSINKITTKINLTEHPIWKELLYILDTIEKYNFVMNGSTLHPNNKNTYYVLICDTPSKVEESMYFFLLYLLFSKSNYKSYIGIDFEYNNFYELRKVHKQFKDKTNRETALIQFACDICCMNKVYIILIDPKDIVSNKLYHNIVTKLLCSPAKKILHGGDGLDIPYLYKHFFKNKKDILQFTANLYDTKFLCDYLNIIRSNKTKCNIYSFLHNENIMSPRILQQLEENEKAMGPIQLIYTDVKKLDPKFTKYAIYDVIYLKELLIKVLEYNTPDLDKVIDMTRLTFLIRMDIIKIHHKTENIKSSNNILEQIDYFKNIYRKLKSSDKNISILNELDIHSL